MVGVIKFQSQVQMGLEQILQQKIYCIAAVFRRLFVNRAQTRTVV